MLTILLYFFIFIAVIDIALIICLFACPPGKLQKIIFYFLSIFVIIISLIDFVSQASNNILGKIIGLMPAVIALIAAIGYTKNIKVILMKILLIVAVIINALSMMLF